MACACSFFAPSSHGERITLKNGMQVEGAVGKIGSFANDNGAAKSPADGPKVKTIILVDDDLRRIYFPMYQVNAEPAPSLATGTIRLTIPQRVMTSGKTVVSVGPIMRVTPFDEWGRRIITMNTANGPLDVVQGITLVTPTFLQVEGLTGRGALVWNMRMATSSLPRERLSRILMQHIDRNNSDQRLQIVQLYLQAERIQDARQELELVLADFPQLADLQNQVRTLNQLGAQRLMKEVSMRKEAGQHDLAINMLSNFPAEGVAGEMLLKVREELELYSDLKKNGEQLLLRLKRELDSVAEERQRTEATAWCSEIASDLNANNLSRLVDFDRLAEDPDLSAERKVALAISGWMMGAGQGIENLPTALSLGRVRELLRIYLNADRKVDRDAAFAALKSEEGATQAYVAKILANMLPPKLDRPPVAGISLPALQAPVPGVIAVDDPLLKPGGRKAPAKPAEKKVEPAPAKEPAAVAVEANDPNVPPGEVPGLLSHVVAGLPEDPEIRYEVQLPPEYDPYRRYPVIFTLNGAGTTPLQQIEWWAGTYDEKSRLRYGQAGRHGYIVVAPHWQREHQRDYEYSAREHAAVLYVLRDTCRRYSVDTDRVFLSGHSLGGDAAWDIGISHPDLWAGVIPIVATGDKYIFRYTKNAERVPLYFVSGQLDGSKRNQNSTEWDRYLSKASKDGYDTMIVEYLGRGHEHFYEEVQNIFEWMRLHQRNFFPKNFTASSMRPWDTFFWWIEIDDLPAAANLNPIDWEASSARARAVDTEGKAIEPNGVRASSAAGKVTVWLSPELLDFQNAESPPTVIIKGKRFFNPPLSLEVMLDDVRTRADRLHPFWGKVEN